MRGVSVNQSKRQNVSHSPGKTTNNLFSLFFKHYNACMVWHFQNITYNITYFQNITYNVTLIALKDTAFESRMVKRKKG
jgi:hypothetical protein